MKREFPNEWTVTKTPLKALLRAKEEAELPWILSQIERHFGRKVKALDMSAKEGFLANRLAELGHDLTACDPLDEAIELAKKGDKTASVCYHRAEPTHLPFPSRCFDVLFAMDLFETIQNPEAVIQEANRLLTHRGLLFFRTLNRTPFSHLLMGRRCLIYDPNEDHYAHFFKPDEMEALLEKNSLMVKKFYGLRPRVNLPVFWKLITKKSVAELDFTLTSSLLVSYGGVAVKEDMRIKSVDACLADHNLFLQERI